MCFSGLKPVMTSLFVQHMFPLVMDYEMDLADTNVALLSDEVPSLRSKGHSLEMVQGSAYETTDKLIWG